jgi:dTDP-4-dehydrorhamnose reductase
VSPRILQFGATGQVGIEMAARAPRQGLDLTALSRAEADLTEPAACAEAVRRLRPDLVVLAAAYTAVDQAESDPKTAHLVNAETPGAIARACAEVGAALVGFSTDYVFAGDSPRPYVETDPTGPLNVYGQSKLAGEAAILAALPRALILRTSWVVSAHGKNFVKTMLRLAGEGGSIRVVDDQIGRPTAAGDLADFVLAQAPRLAAAPAGDPVFGVTHFANAGEVSWRGFAQGVFELACGEKAPVVAAITTADRPAPAARPLRGVLDTARLEAVFGVTPRPWRAALAEIVADLTNPRKASAA